MQAIVDYIKRDFGEGNVDDIKEYLDEIQAVEVVDAAFHKKVLNAITNAVIRGDSQAYAVNGALATIFKAFSKKTIKVNAKKWMEANLK
jgi:hypothetical protein